MNILLLFNTIKHLKPIQIYYQIYHRIIWRKYHAMLSVATSRLNYTDWIAKPISKDGDFFRFLNIYHKFTSWVYTSNGSLWAYNLNYMDWLLQPEMTFKEGSRWIDRFIDDIDENNIGLDPYPTALRCINWVKFISLHYNDIDPVRLRRWDDSLYSQYRLLERKLEYHLLGNHLLEDAYSLFIASLFFNDSNFYRKSTNILRQQLKEQILEDGAHFEQSPMYHCILLDRLLDCYNFSINNILFKNQENFNNFLKERAIKMLGHFESIVYSDGTIPLLNDSAYRIAPTPQEIFEYARRLSLKWSNIKLSDCGYRKLKNDRIETIIDIGNIKASYQPGHSHADTFSYELKIDGTPFIVDTGISTYEKNQRRQYERSTAAHNTVSIDGMNSSEVWGGFRIGNRASVTVIEDSNYIVKASHDGFGKLCIVTREFNIHSGLNVIDTIPEDCVGISYIHIAPRVNIVSMTDNCISTDLAKIVINNAKSIEIADSSISTEYNNYQSNKVVKIHFSGKLEYNIILS